MCSIIKFFLCCKFLKSSIFNYEDEGTDLEPIEINFGPYTDNDLPLSTRIYNITYT